MIDDVSIWGMYLRLSRDDLRGGEVSDANSTQGQRRFCLAYIERQDPGAQVVEYAEEEFISASKGLERPQYVRMLEAVTTGDLDHIVARDQDRFTRDRDIEFGQLKALAKAAGVQVHAADSGALFSSLDRELASGIRSEFGSFFAKITGANTKKGLATRRAEGHWTTAGRTFGYLKGGEVNTEQAKHIRWAYDQILNYGKTARFVFEHWRANDVQTVNGQKWTSVGRVMDMLRRPLLAGHVTYKGEVLEGVTGQWEPIVTPDELVRMRAALSARATSERGYGKRSYRKHWLAGLVLCGNPDCDLLTMSSQYPGGGRPYYYLHCDRRRGGCGNRLRGPDLERVVQNASLALVMQLPAPPEESSPGWDDTVMNEIERQIRDVRAALRNRTMLAADAVPVLGDLRAQLAEQQTLKEQHLKADQASQDWHMTQWMATMGGEGAALRRVVNNIRVLPNHGGVIIEGAGVAIEIGGEAYDVAKSEPEPFSPERRNGQFVSSLDYGPLENGVMRLLVQA